MVCEPWPISTMAITAPTPNMTPSAVKADRILFRHSAPRAVRSVGGSIARAGAAVPAAPPLAADRASVAAGDRRRCRMAVDARSRRVGRRGDPGHRRHAAALPAGMAIVAGRTTVGCPATSGVWASSPSISPSLMRIVRWA